MVKTVAWRTGKMTQGAMSGVWGGGKVRVVQLHVCMEMNGGLKDRATALNTDGKCCGLREVEEEKRRVKVRGLTCVRFKLNIIESAGERENKHGLSLLRVQRRMSTAAVPVSNHVNLKLGARTRVGLLLKISTFALFGSYAMASTTLPSERAPSVLSSSKLTAPGHSTVSLTKRLLFPHLPPSSPHHRFFTHPRPIQPSMQNFMTL